jgi:selenocysteine lyase/cysteine desulfurase
MCEALRFILTVNRVEEQARVNALSMELQRQLHKRGLHLLTPNDPALTSGIVSFEHPQATSIGEALERAGVIVWAGDGRVRASLHFYSDATDLDLYFAALDSVLASLRAG